MAGTGRSRIPADAAGRSSRSVKLAVFGATGPTGRQVVAQALQRGDSVTAFVRDPAPLPLSDPRLRVVVGDATRDASAIDEALRGQDAVICALGRGRSFQSGQLMERAMQAIVPALERAGVRRLVLMSSFGVSEPPGDSPLSLRLMARLLLGDIFADKLAAEARVRASSLEWTLVHPVMLANGPVTGRYRAGERLGLRGLPRISRADVAHFMLAEAEGRRFVRKTAVLSY